MSHLSDPSSPQAVPTPPICEPHCTEQSITNSPAAAEFNPFLDLDRWLDAITSDGSLPCEAHAVASVMARSVGIGRVAFTDWQRINAVLGRGRRDLAVFKTMSELALAGYIDRNIDDRFGRSYGWSLLIPEGEL